MHDLVKFVFLEVLGSASGVRCYVSADDDGRWFREGGKDHRGNVHACRAEQNEDGIAGGESAHYRVYWKLLIIAKTEHKRRPATAEGWEGRVRWRSSKGMWGGPI